MTGVNRLVRRTVTWVVFYSVLALVIVVSDQFTQPFYLDV